MNLQIAPAYATNSQNPVALRDLRSIAMLVGRALLDDQKIQLTDMTPSNFATLDKNFRENQPGCHAEAVKEISEALDHLYGKRERNISLQQLAATFRRGDLLEKLSGISLSQSGLLFL